MEETSLKTWNCKQFLRVKEKSFDFTRKVCHIDKSFLTSSVFLLKNKFKVDLHFLLNVVILLEIILTLRLFLNLK